MCQSILISPKLNRASTVTVVNQLLHWYFGFQSNILCRTSCVWNSQTALDDLNMRVRLCSLSPSVRAGSSGSMFGQRGRADSGCALGLPQSPKGLCSSPPANASAESHVALAWKAALCWNESTTTTAHCRWAHALLGSNSFAGQRKTEVQFSLEQHLQWRFFLSHCHWLCASYGLVQYQSGQWVTGKDDCRTSHFLVDWQTKRSGQWESQGSLFIILPLFTCEMVIYWLIIYKRLSQEYTTVIKGSMIDWGCDACTNWLLLDFDLWHMSPNGLSACRSPGTQLPGSKQENLTRPLCVFCYDRYFDII